MAANNIVIEIGRLTNDPELKVTPSGVNVTSFTIAVDRPAKAGEEKVADFLTVVAWRGTADFVCKYFKKGSAIVVKGSLQSRNYTDSQGNKRYVTEIVADEIGFGLSDRNQGENKTVSTASDPATKAPTSTRKAKSKPEPVEGVDEDDLPF